MITIPFVRRRSHEFGWRKLRGCAERARTRQSRKPRVERLESRELLAADLAITEFMASNGSSLTDGDGNTPDWIEIYNRGDQAATLAGWRLTDQADRPDKWEFPFVSLEAGSYLIVFASGKDRAEDSSRLRRDFHSTSDGTFLVDLPQGTYDVRLTFGDETRPRDQVAIHLQDTLVDTVMTAAGEYAVRTFTAEVDDPVDGRLVLRLKDLGGVTARAAIDALVITSRDGGEERRFDFGTADSPVEPSFTAIATTSIYNEATGYGWQPGTVVGSQDRGVDTDELHTNFKLSAKGEMIQLVSPDGTVVSRFGIGGEDYPQQVTDVSYGSTDQGARYFAVPTPGAANAAGQVGFSGATDMSVDHGFFNAPFQVDLTTETPGATIRYTTDGSTPTEIRGTVATGPLTIDGTTVLRAAAFKPEHVPGQVATRTYLFLNDVIEQPSDPEGFPTIWGQVTADYGMDPNVVDVAPYNQTIIEGLQTIPTMSLVLDNDDFFGPDGIYANPRQRGRSWERPVSVEYFDPRNDRRFDINAGLRVHGGSARDPNITPQHSLRLHFRNEYGASQLDFPLFDDSPITRFDALVLNAQSSDNWTSANLQTGKVAQFMRDQWAQDMQREMGHVYVPGSYVHLYINGLYWGLYDIMERPDAAFAAAHFGGTEEEYDVIVDEVASQGDLNAWNDLLGRVRAGDYQGTLELLDVDNFIDYMILNMYMGNWDWPDHNWQAVRRRADGEQFTFLVWDAEVGLGLDVNVPGPIAPRKLDLDLTGLRADVSASNLANGPGEIYHLLRTIPDFQSRFADRLHKHLFNGGALTPERATAVYAARADEIDEALVGEAARWGDVRREPPDVPDGTWLAEKEWILSTFFPRRGEILLDDFRDVDLYPDTTAPSFNQHGGNVPRRFELAINNENDAGDVYYTLDGIDPRVSELDWDSVDGLQTALDFHATPDGTFAIDLPNGSYDVLLTQGDFAKARDKTMVFLEGNPTSAEPFDTEAGEIVTRTHSVDVTDGQLTIRIEDQGGVSARSTLAGLIVRSSESLVSFAFDFGTQGSPVESGFTPVYENDRYSRELGYGWLGDTNPTISSQDRSADAVVISPTAELYDRPILLTESIRVKARTVADGQWSALNEANFTIVEKGDLDLNGKVDTQDIDALVLGLTRPQLYEATYNADPFVAGDTDGDGDLDFDDIVGFVALVTGNLPTVEGRSDARPGVEAG